MNDSPQLTAWPAICGVLAVLCCGSVVCIVMLYKLVVENQNWKRRWNDDTQFFANEVKVAAQKIADESYARVQAERRATELLEQFENLKAQYGPPPRRSEVIEPNATP